MATSNKAAFDFTNIKGKLNPAQHGSNSAPPYSRRWLFNMDEEFKSLHFMYARTHDWPLWNPGQRLIDTHFIFPLMHLDPKDPKNYYFRATDEMLRITQEAGMKIFYRLGTSIEHNSDQANEHNNTLVPEDFDHYAEVLAGIVRHYTQGWANGFNYDIEYWEIWNEPELGTQTWCGTKEEFARFFVTVLKRLKSEFPKIKVGGPAFTTPLGEWQNAVLQACKDANIAPDFYSCHCYTNEPEKLIRRPREARELLDSFGFTETEVSINEWHFRQDWSGVTSRAPRDLVRYTMDGPLGHCNIQSAVFNLAVLIGWQDEPLETACYYGAGPDGSFGYRDHEHRWNKCFYSMRMFGEVVSQYVYKVAVDVTPHPYRNIYAMGVLSEDKEKAAILIADYAGNEAATCSFAIKGVENYRCVEARILDNTLDLAPCQVNIHGNTLTVAKNDPGSAAWLIEFEKIK